MKIKEILSESKVVDIVQFRRDNVEDVYDFTKGRLHNVVVPRCIDEIMKGEIDTIKLDNSIDILENDYIFKSEDMNFIVYRPNKFEDKKDIVKTICEYVFNLDDSLATFRTEFKLKDCESIYESNTVVPIEFLKLIKSVFNVNIF